MEFFVELQTPTVEHEVKAKDASGHSSSIIVAFKRYERKEAQEKMEETSAFLTDNNTEGYKNFIAEQIVYYKKVTLMMKKPNGELYAVKVADSREITEKHDLYDPDVPLTERLTEKFLNSTPWWLAIATACQYVLANMDVEGESAKAKN